MRTDPSAAWRCGGPPRPARHARRRGGPTRPWSARLAKSRRCVITARRTAPSHPARRAPQPSARASPCLCHLILSLVYVMLVFFLTFIYYSSNSKLQHLCYSLSASTFSLSVNTTILEFIFCTINLRKKLYKNLKYYT
jgi:hypothetical protein